ncbi:MAG: putative NTE family protein [Calditrichaeota bacterium]|nr:putative NTE family protein [Calditrichota bacterium]
MCTIRAPIPRILLAPQITFAALAVVLLSALLSRAPAAAPDPWPDSVAWTDYRDGTFSPAAHGLREARVPHGFLPELEGERPAVALALSGGGARGLAHIGVFQGIAEHGLPVDLVVGSSMGGVIAGLYSVGFTPDELAGIARSLDWGALFTDAPSRRNLFLAQKETANRDLLTLRFRRGRPYIPNALVTGQTLFLETFRLLHEGPYAPVGDSFNGGRTRVGLVATDIVSGEKVYLAGGDLAIALRAAMAVPILFRPYREDGMLLVDGGATENIPVRAARDHGADVVIAVDCASPTADPDPDMPWEILNQVTTLMTAPNDSLSRALADVVIKPDLSAYGNTEFDAAEQIIAAGRAMFASLRDSIAALAPPPEPAPDLIVDLSAVDVITDAPRKLARRLPSLSLTPGPHSTRDINARLTRYLRELRARGYGFATVRADVNDGGELRVHVNLGVLGELSASGVSEREAAVQLRELHLEIGRVLKTEDALDALKEIHATQRYTTVYCELDRLHDGRVSLHFLLEPAPPVRVSLGLGYSTDWGARYQATLVVEQPLPIIGEELRLRAKYGEHRELYGVHLRADRLAGSYAGWRGSITYAATDVPRYYPSGNRERYAYLGKTTANATALFNLSTWGRLSAGVAGQWVEDDIDPGKREYFYNAVELTGELDTEDRRPFPSSGTRLDVSYSSYISPLGSDRAFSVLDVNGRLTMPLYSRMIARVEARGGIAELTTPSTHRFAIGGLESFPALPPYRYLALRHVGANVTLRYDLISRLVADAYILARYDAIAFGNERDWRPTRDDILRSISLAFALDTRLGPLEIWSAWAPPSTAYGYEHRIAVNFGFRF